jgi:LPS export ABC transporter protein LptC
MVRWWPLLALCALGACKNDLDQLAAIEVDADAPDRITTRAEYLYSDSGHVRNRLRAGKVAEYMAEGKQRTELSDGVELVFFDVLGEEGSRLTAKRGLISPKQERMEVFEQVVFTNIRGERLETEHLIWEQDSGRVFTDGPVKITRDRSVIYGDGLDADQDFSWYTIRKITGTLYVQPGDSTPPTPTTN